MAGEGNLLLLLLLRESGAERSEAEWSGVE